METEKKETIKAIINDDWYYVDVNEGTEETPEYGVFCDKITMPPSLESDVPARTDCIQIAGLIKSEEIAFILANANKMHGTLLTILKELKEAHKDGQDKSSIIMEKGIIKSIESLNLKSHTEHVNIRH